MKIVTNTKLIQRNRRIGQILSLGSLAVLGVGLYISFRPELLSYSFIALIIGFMISQIGIYFGNRWGRSPRPDEQLTSALKGLDDKYTLYHYTAPVSHLLVGPSGLWVLLPYNQTGVITYQKGRWKQKGGSLYLKVFAQESMGRPDMDVKSSLEDIQKFVNKELGDMEKPPIQAAVVFTNPKVEVKAPEAPIPTLEVDKLKDLIRKKVKENSKLFAPESLKVITSALPEPEKEA
jgi:hypothetical protein